LRLSCFLHPSYHIYLTINLSWELQEMIFVGIHVDFLGKQVWVNIFCLNEQNLDKIIFNMFRSKIIPIINVLYSDTRTSHQNKTSISSVIGIRMSLSTSKIKRFSFTASDNIEYSTLSLISFTPFWHFELQQIGIFNK
jgi:hypothetical protein